jgi:integrase
MNGRLRAVPCQPARAWAQVLAEAVRAEFDTDYYQPEPDDPSLAVGSCRVGGCEAAAHSRRLCESHHRQWSAAGKPDLDGFVAAASPSEAVRRAPRAFDLAGLGQVGRLEWCYVLQCRHEERGAPLTPGLVSEVIRFVRRSVSGSLLERPVGEWVDDLAIHCPGRRSHQQALLRYAYARLEDLAADGDPDIVYGRDVWDARRLGIEAHRSPHRITFAGIDPAWLRAAVKAWGRFRLATGSRFSTVAGDVAALRVFSRYLSTRSSSPSASEAGIDRALIEDYQLYLVGSGRQTATRVGLLVALKGFLEHGRRHGVLPRLAASAVIYPEDLPRRPPAVPRFIDEAAMATLESDQALSRLPDATTRNLVVVLIETGLRLGDACLLAFDCVMVDSTGWPCLRYSNSKVATECLVPLSERAATTIAAQQTHVRSQFPAGSPLLFPRERANPDGARPYVTTTLSGRLRAWCHDIDLRDQMGHPLTVTAHRFRHTLGTRMINQGVPVHIVQHYLGHATPQMTNVYAHLHDRTMRAAFDAYATKRVNIAGQALSYDAESPTSDAEWIKHNLARVADSLPNGYCGRPPQRDCPHPNACLTCPDFQTTPEFLPVHRAQAATNRRLIAQAQADGRFRLVTNLSRVQDSLDAIIPALEALQPDGHTDAS